MRLSVASHPITNIQFGDHTRLDGTILSIDKDALTRYLLEDSRLTSINLEIVRPGDVSRFGIVYDIMEPRVKEPGSGPNFPGILDPISGVGEGTTHALQGMAITVLDSGAPVASGKIVEMSGPAGEACPYSSLYHLVVVPTAVARSERHTMQNALRLASVKACVYLAETALGVPAAATEIFECSGPDDSARDGIPRIAYIGQIHSRQRVSEVDEQILYGANTAGMVPVILHPNEWIDGALVTSHSSMGVETYFYQNSPIISELYRWHREGRIILVGTIATMAASDNGDRARNAMLAARQAQWNLAANGVILTKYGGGAPHADMSLTARLCEELGMQTTVQVSDMSRDRRAESALLFNYPEVDAIVYVGGNDTRWAVPALERVVGGSPEATEALGKSQELDASRVCGVVSQQGASKLRAFVT